MDSLAILDRQCGTCGVCCILPSISDFDKPMHEPCRYLNSCGYGCSIYPDRPPVCSGFQCLWRAGHLDGDEAFRPDKLGFMMVYSRKDDKLGFSFIIAWETHEGALDQPGIKPRLYAIAQGQLVVVRRFKKGSPIPLGPLNLVRMFNQVYPDSTELIEKKLQFYFR